MTTILKPGMEKIFSFFYANKEAKIHLRGLSREVGLQGQSIVRYLVQLEKENLLKSEKDGNQKKYSIRHNKSVYALFTLFNIKQFEKLPEIRKNAITYYLNQLSEKPAYAILFGSTAKENYGESSDIDILIITNKRIDATEAEKEADALTSLKISTFQMEYKDFLMELRLKEDKVVQSAIKTGYPLINHIMYYEELYNERI